MKTLSVTIELETKEAVQVRRPDTGAIVWFDRSAIGIDKIVREGGRIVGRNAVHIPDQIWDAQDWDFRTDVPRDLRF